VSRFIAVAHATAQGLCPCSVIVALLMLALGSTGAADNPALSPEDSRFVRTVVHLQQSEPELRADFVEVALVLLAEAYADEASLAREAATVAADNDKLLGWAAAVERYSQQLPLLVEDVELGFPARLTLGVDGVLSISVAERRLMLMHPRVDQQAVFEQAILATFCRRHNCAAFTEQQAGLEPIPVSAASVKPQWTFTENGAVCGYGGLEVDFGSGADIARTRVTCEQFLHEAITLGQEIAWQRRHAVRVDWHELTLRPLPSRPGHALGLNAAGDTLLATVPLIYGSPGLLRAITPWLRAEVMQTTGPKLRLRAADFGWVP
tara:strand:+ start:3530 stop:4492 length:963 start_codon:yes stop_codon:yes gene_type:complete